MVLNILDLNESDEEIMEFSVHEDLLNTLEDELVTEGDNNQHGSLKPSDKEESNETNKIEKAKVTKICMSGHLDVERLKESDRSGSETGYSTHTEYNGMGGRENKPPRVPDLEVPMFSDKTKKMKPI